MQARDGRWAEISRLTTEAPSVVTVTANRPGLHKDHVAAHAVVHCALTRLEEALAPSCRAVVTRFDALGAFCALAVDGAPRALKERALVIEEGPLGRLSDIDVYTRQGDRVTALSRTALGRPARRCFLCGDTAQACRYLQRHTADDLVLAFDTAVASYVATLTPRARTALAVEAALWGELCRPYGLGAVTLNGVGAHSDMDVSLMRRSLHVVAHAVASLPDDVRSFSALRRYGKTAERALLAATGGVNTHKGALFHLLLLTATWRTLAAEPRDDRLTARWSERLAALAAPLQEDLDEARGHPDTAETAGLKSHLAYGDSGARTLALSGYATLLTTWLPRFQAQPWRETVWRELVLATWDTTLVKRGGGAAVRALRERAHAAETDDDWHALSDWCVSHGYTTGGVADVLGLLYYAYWRVTFG